MGKLLGFILKFTKLGKATEPVQKFLSGKKSYLAGLGLAVPALLVMIQKFADQGVAYFPVVLSSEEWTLFMNGLAVMGVRAAITKAADPKKDPN